MYVIKFSEVHTFSIILEIQIYSHDGIEVISAVTMAGMPKLASAPLTKPHEKATYCLSETDYQSQSTTVVGYTVRRILCRI